MMNFQKRSIWLLIVTLLVIVASGIVLTDQSDAARYIYSSDVVPEASIPKLDRYTYVFLNKYGSQLKVLSYSYGVDWRLALAVLRAESNFDTEAVSDRGAFGLMQLMPETGLHLASLNDVNNIADPVSNMKLGIIHLRDLLRQFPNAEGQNRVGLAVAAYNCGLSRIQDAQTIAGYLGDNPDSWTSIRASLQLLSKRYSLLHRHIWSSGRPTSGYFGEYSQTENYVENVLHYYNIYKNVLKR
ncbi:MAG: transglycosylase SLT domain-containing protein [Candidatus Kryptoniota bacterium]